MAMNSVYLANCLTMSEISAMEDSKASEIPEYVMEARPPVFSTQAKADEWVIRTLVETINDEYDIEPDDVQVQFDTLRVERSSDSIHTDTDGVVHLAVYARVRRIIDGDTSCSEEQLGVGVVWEVEIDENK